MLLAFPEENIATPRTWDEDSVGRRVAKRDCSVHPRSLFYGKRTHCREGSGHGLRTVQTRVRDPRIGLQALGRKQVRFFAVLPKPEVEAANQLEHPRVSEEVLNHRRLLANTEAAIVEKGVRVDSEGVGNGSVKSHVE